MHNKANSLGRQKAPLRSAFLPPVICGVEQIRYRGGCGNL